MLRQSRPPSHDVQHNTKKHTVSSGSLLQHKLSRLSDRVNVWGLSLPGMVSELERPLLNGTVPRGRRVAEPTVTMRRGGDRLDMDFIWNNRTSKISTSPACYERSFGRYDASQNLCGLRSDVY